jgi:hypothetical protein
MIELFRLKAAQLTVPDRYELRDMEGKFNPIYAIADHSEEVIYWDHYQPGRLEPPVSRLHYRHASRCTEKVHPGPAER